MSGDTDNPEGGAEGGAKEAEGGGEAQDGAAGRAVRADHRRDAPEAVGKLFSGLRNRIRSDPENFHRIRIRILSVPTLAIFSIFRVAIGYPHSNFLYFRN